METTEKSPRPPQRFKTRPFYRKLVAAMLLSSLVILVATGYGIFHVFQKRIIHQAERESMDIGEFLIAEHRHLLLTEKSEGQFSLSLGQAGLERLDQSLRSMLPVLKVVKVKIYDTAETIVYSTEFDLIGEIDTDNARLERALAGAVDTHLESKAQFRDLAGERKLDVDVVETYLPVEVDGEVVGVLELYRDVTSFTQQIFITSLQAVLLLGTILLLANGTFFLFLQRTSRSLSEAEQQLRTLATTDALTGVYNHGTIVARTQAEFSRVLRHREQGEDLGLGVLMLDLDHFKKINDSFGHLAGDEVLRELCQRVRPILRDYDLLGRFGGEEFLVALPDADFAEASGIAERIRQAIAVEPCFYEGSAMDVTVSVGVASVTPRDERFARILQRADKGLYLAKQEGRNRVASTEQDVRQALSLESSGRQ